MARGGPRKGAGRKPKAPVTDSPSAPPSGADPYGDAAWLEEQRKAKLTPRMKREGVTTAKPKKLGTLDDEEIERLAKIAEATLASAPRVHAPPEPALGRPSEFKPEYVAQAEKLCRLGATDDELGDFFGCNRTTIWRWAQKHEDFCNAIRSGKIAADERVERSLYNRAVGYTYDAVKIFMPAGASEPVYAAYSEHVPPDVTAQKLWLINRRAELWRDKREVAHSHTMKAGDLTDDDLADIARRGGEGTVEPPGDPRVTH